MRIMVTGSCGSGKSRLARAISARAGVPVFHLDRLYHRPGWTDPPPGAFAADVARIAALPAWVIDGNYVSTSAPRLRAADTLIFLEVRRTVAVVRVLRRLVLGYGRQRPDSADGCPERFDFAFLRYVWRWQRDVCPRVRAMGDGFAGRHVVLASKREVRAFLATL